MATLMVAAPAAQAFWDRKDDQRHAKRHVSEYQKRYGTTYIQGFPDDCAMLAKRAHLTGSAYWRYAAARCRHSHYSYH